MELIKKCTKCNKHTFLAGMCMTAVVFVLTYIYWKNDPSFRMYSRIFGNRGNSVVAQYDYGMVYAEGLINNINSTNETVVNRLEYIEYLLEPFHKDMEKTRSLLLKTVAGRPLRISSFLRKHRKYVPQQNNYLKEVTKNGVHTVQLVANMDAIKQILLRNYYFITTTNDAKCAARKHGKYKNDSNIFRYSHGISDSFIHPKPLFPYLLEYNLPGGTKNNADQVTLTFVHLIPNAIVLPEGHVLYKGMVLAPGSCSNGRTPMFTRKKAKQLLHLDEVFVIGAFWGDGYFHFTVEDLPRIAPSLTFLRTYPNIKIQVESKSSFVVALLDMLGIAKHRLVSGYMAAKLVYIPAGTRCGTATTFDIQLLSFYMRSSDALQKQDSIRNKMNVVLIKRSKKRYFNYHDAILKKLTDLVNGTGGHVEVFDDRQLPGLNRTAKIFNEARIVVAPHGAGLSNLIFCKPETLVVEGLCLSPDLNLCYARLSHTLGHLYYGIVPRYDCKKTTAKDIVSPIKEYLKLINVRNVT